MTSHRNDAFRPVARWHTVAGTAFKCVLLAAFVAGAWYVIAESSKPKLDTATTIVAEKRTFTHSLRRNGTIMPLNEERIFTKLAGTILDIANEGSLVQKDEIVLKLDPRPHEDIKAEYEETVGELGASYRSLREESLKILNLARENAKSYDLRLKLQQLRLDEIKKGPTETDAINAKMALENNTVLHTAKQEELAAITSLAKLGYASVEELRQKQTETVEQHFAVLQKEIALRKLNIIDPVKVAEQEMKVNEALKTRNAAKERVELLEYNIRVAEERNDIKKKRNEESLAELVANIAKTTYRAPCSGLIVPRKTSYGFRYAPGRDVYDGMEILTIPDLSKMKVKLTVDEGHVSRISIGMKAQVVPAGWTGKPFEGIVTKISEQGRDEFEQFQEDTTAISGTANRKVFDVEVGLQDHAPILRLGLRCDIEIVLNQIPNAVVVPRAALSKQKDGDVIAPMAGPNGTTVRRKIKLIDESELWAAIEGVSPGERLVLSESNSN
ncbi:MAG: hypothetical protein WCT04_16305 [Planctomycetota bacterium]